MAGCAVHFLELVHLLADLPRLVHDPADVDPLRAPVVHLDARDELLDVDRAAVVKVEHLEKVVNVHHVQRDADLGKRCLRLDVVDQVVEPLQRHEACAVSHGREQQLHGNEPFPPLVDLLLQHVLLVLRGELGRVVDEDTRDDVQDTEDSEGDVQAVEPDEHDADVHQGCDGVAPVDAAGDGQVQREEGTLQGPVVLHQGRLVDAAIVALWPVGESLELVLDELHHADCNDVHDEAEEQEGPGQRLQGPDDPRHHDPHVAEEAHDAQHPERAEEPQHPEEPEERHVRRRDQPDRHDPAGEAGGDEQKVEDVPAEVWVVG
mmetsp:Transcript_126449/g.357654  ORF Transcript_126449/g.357654 Transcript_126449/m.357654 type:complete len:319 (+) Transcript_126449:164-1120(+)